MKIMVTGGAGFIGSAAVRRLSAMGHEIVVVDALTYAGDRRRIDGVARTRFEHTDIRDLAALTSLVRNHAPDAVLHCAAESHVDRSIDAPAAFIDTNVLGTFNLLEAALGQVRAGRALRFVHVSTDEVYGSLGATGRFTETTAYAPNSPYAASKAASDHLVRAWHETYGLHACVTHCTNNYGPYQHAEKFVPTVIRCALSGEPIPLYGSGTNVRDWLYVDDHVDALLAVLERGQPGRAYAIGARNELTNRELALRICTLLDELRPSRAGSHADGITLVADRPGHDLRYAIEPARIEAELGWKPCTSAADALRSTVRWYLENEAWWRPDASAHRRLGLAQA